MAVRYAPSEDGITHINIYSKGATALGKQLSNLADIPLDHPKYGKWPSVENLWYWLSTGRREDLFDTFNGCGPWKAKKLGRDMARVPYDDFQQDICEAIRSKILGLPSLSQLLKESSLPFAHYFAYGEVGPGGFYKLIDLSDKYQWQIELISNIRQELKGNNDGQL